MLEFAALFGLSTIIADRAAVKGRSRRLWVTLLVLLTLGGEGLGALLGHLLMPGTFHRGVMYGPALVGAVCGALLAFYIERKMPMSAQQAQKLRERKERAAEPDLSWLPSDPEGPA